MWKIELIIRKTELIIIHPSTAMSRTKTGSPFYLLSLSNMLDLTPGTSVHSSSLLYFDGLSPPRVELGDRKIDPVEILYFTESANYLHFIAQCGWKCASHPKKLQIKVIQNWITNTIFQGTDNGRKKSEALIHRIIYANCFVLPAQRMNS